MIHAYAERFSVNPGETLGLGVSTDASKFDARCVRLLHGDPNPSGPGTIMEPVAWIGRTEHEGENQPLRIGSYAKIPGLRSIPGEFTLGCWVLATAPTKGGECVIFAWGERNEILLHITPQNRLHLRLADRSVECSLHVAWGRWYFVGFAYNAATLRAKLFVGIHGALGPEVRGFTSGRLPDGTDSGLLIAGKQARAGVEASFNGKIGQISLWSFFSDDIDLCRLQNGWSPDRRGTLLGEWDFSQRIDSDQLVDRSGWQRHGKLYQAPTRGVTGPSFTGPDSKVWLAAPNEYNAAHFHQDDLEDADWKLRVVVNVPSEARSGIYAVLLKDSNGAEWSCPFIVRPEAKRESRLLFVVPTLTWLAYGNRGNPAHEVAFGPSLYGAHCDGSPVYHVSLRRPISTLGAGSYFAAASLASDLATPCSHLLMADLYLIHWLEHIRMGYDVISDHDLHQGGSDLLGRYRAVICAGHHEYWTGNMLNGMEDYLSNKGRAVFLSGNALYWAASIAPGRQHLLEVRRSGGTGTGEADPGELQHAFEFQRGGTWHSLGRPPNLVTGVGFAATGFTERGSAFEILDRGPSSISAFEGIGPNEVIGDFGLNQGGAAGFELDRANYATGTPTHAWRLATTPALPASFFGTVEDGVGRAPSDEKVRGDVVYIERPDGGKVFTAGSVTWTGSLSHNNYSNNVARLTGNVVRQFLDEA